MSRAITATFLILLGLGLSGCAIGDGIAHVVKKTSEAFSGGEKSPPPAAATATAEPERAQPPVDIAPPPPPAAAPSRSSVSVESLPPP